MHKRRFDVFHRINAGGRESILVTDIGRKTQQS